MRSKWLPSANLIGIFLKSIYRVGLIDDNLALETEVSFPNDFQQLRVIQTRSAELFQTNPLPNY